MQLISRFEQDSRLDRAVAAGQRAARLIRPGKVRDVPGDHTPARRLTAAGLAAAVPAAVAGAADWSEQHEQQMRVGVVHAAANLAAMSLYGASLLTRSRRGPVLRLAGLACVAVSGLAGGHISFRLAGGANHAEQVPHLVEPGWHYLMDAAELPDGQPVRQLLGEVPVVAVRVDGAVRVLADRCSHMSGPLSEGELAGGCLTCPWHGSVFRLADGSVARGPATAPQPAFGTREAGGAIQVCLPGAG
jgi:nitrite reductase/ring-hydroxylating ferredoxin subunit